MLNFIAALVAVALLGASAIAAANRFRSESRDERHDGTPNAPA